MPSSLHPEHDGFDGVWLAELEMLLFVVFDQLGEKLEPGAPGGPRIRIERYQQVHLLKIAAVLLFRFDDADVHDRRSILERMPPFAPVNENFADRASSP